MNRFVIIMAVAVVAFIGLIIFNKQDAKAPEGNSNITSSEHIVSPDAPVKLVEFGDFQCPACAAYYPIIKQIKAEYGDKLSFQFRHFPIVSIHPNAMSAHRAAEAAGRQDKFWEMHDLLYERQSAWTNSKSPASVFEGFAQELGLDLEKYKQDLASSEIQDIINADLRAGQEAKVTATPGFVLNGKKLEENPRDIESFKKLIDEALNEQQ